VKYRQLGRWGVKVSTVSLGSWLTYGGSVEEEASATCIRRAYELGVNFFDTADGYNGGRAEEVLGATLADFPRESVFVGTKVFFPRGPGPNDGGLSRKHIVEQAHRSLRRLQMDYVDLIQCHRYDEHTPLEETCRTFDDLIRQGKLLYWGVSEWSADQILHAVDLCRREGWSVPVSNQPQYSALYRRIERRVLPTCADVGMGNVVWSPLAQGVLTGKYKSVDDVPADSRAAGDNSQFIQGFLRAEVLDAVSKLEPIASDAGCSLAQLALAWCLRQPMVSSVIAGATKVSQVEDNVAAADLELEADVFDAVTRILDPVAVK
jgi:voltage-dependent potassium channel beta subunit